MPTDVCAIIVDLYSRYIQALGNELAAGSVT